MSQTVRSEFLVALIEAQDYVKRIKCNEEDLARTLLSYTIGSMESMGVHEIRFNELRIIREESKRQQSPNREKMLHYLEEMRERGKQKGKATFMVSMNEKELELLIECLRKE